MGNAIERIKRTHHQAILDAHACHLRGQGLTYSEIGVEMRCSSRTALRRVQRAYGRMPGPAAAVERQRMLGELEDMALAVYGVMEAAHVAISAKGVVTVAVETPTGTVTVPVPDDHPVLEAVDRLLKIQERRARLLGTDAPSKRSVEVVTKDALVAEMERMTREMADGEGGPR